MDVCNPAEERVDTIRAWNSAISRYGSDWQRGETLRPHPWKPPTVSDPTPLRRHTTTVVHHDPSGVQPPSLSDADALLVGKVVNPGEPSYDCDSLAALVGHAYEPQRCIGIGGMAEVWLAEQRALRRPVAIKALPPGGQARAQKRAFQAEALISSHLSHPNILPVYDAGERYIVMKFIEGTSMAERLEELGAFDIDWLPQMIEALIKVSDAVAFAHGRGVVHCDLKPQNVMLGEWGEVLVMDWGLAVCTGSAKDQHLRSVAREGGSRCAGTPGYMAPEMARRQAVDSACDVFLLGAMLYELMTGHPPFDADSPLGAVVRSVDCEYRPVAECQPLAPSRLVTLQEAAMAPRPADRMTAKGFADTLRDWMGSSRNDVVARQALEQAELMLVEVRGVSARRHWDRLYRVYRDALAHVERALTLVPGDPRAVALREKAMADFKIAAVAAGELFLARLLAGGELPPRGSGRMPAV